ncbi:MAG: oxidoreductase [Candidatus Omnitrophota bacterium]|nr:MAG: oxidoreductase [Candidatus Omnitrophota bacterium]
MHSRRFIGQVGLGYWGKNILRNLFELGVIRIACDIDSGIIRERKKQFPQIGYTTSFKELIENPAIKAIIVSSPATTHYELTKEALMKDKDVFVEKPLALTVKEAEDLIKIAEGRNKILMVGHILQYHPALRKLKDMIDSGQLGKIEYIYSNRLNIGKLRTEENILWSFAPHDVSAILMLLKEEPVRVFAMGGDYINKGIYDTTITLLEFRNGIKAHIFVSWLHPYKEQKLIVVGSKAMAVFDDGSREKLFLYPHKIEWKNGKIPVAEKSEFEAIPINNNKEPLRLELEHFIECVERRSKPFTDGYEGLRVLKVLEKAENSIFRARVFLDRPNLSYFIHESAVVDEGVEIGEGTKIWHFSHILRGSKIGKNCKIGQNVVIGPNVRIGNGCKIQNNVSVYEGVTLEDFVFCGPSCVFTNVFNPRSEIPRMKELKPTLVRKGATIGANATIVCGVTLGRYCFVGAGAVVTKDVPDYALVYGNPAEIKGWMCECGRKLDFEGIETVCKSCKLRYRKVEDRVVRINP